MAQKYKGPRDQFIVRPTAEVGALIREEAAKAGIPFTDFCGAILAEHYGKPAYNEVVSITPQEQLPMTG
jgi:hypothetical protein